MIARNLILVRHGEAKSKEEDPERPLTDEGRAAVQKMAKWLAGSGLHVDEIRHSGKLRAEQTADVFAERLGIPIVAASGLNPNDDVAPIADGLGRESRSITLVGHLPFLGRLAGHLLTRNSEPEIVTIDAAGVVVLNHEDGRWKITCAMPPHLIPPA